MKNKKLTKLLTNVPSEVLLALDAEVFKKPIDPKDLKIATDLGYFKKGKPTPKALYLVNRILKVIKEEGLYNE